MSGATVFIFLLDQLPGFQHALNSTIHWLNKNDDPPFSSSLVHKCDPVVAQSVLNLNKYDIDSTIYDTTKGFINNEIPEDFNDAYKELSPETMYNIRKVFDNSTEDSEYFNSLENSRIISKQHVNNSNVPTNIVNTTESEKENEINDTDKTNSETSDQVKFPVIVPFLVAIFETLSNVTAQTCGGTLLSPHWVLTAASCVDVMSNLYSKTNRSKHSEANASMYTIVIGSDNPFFHGTGHRVTKLNLLPTVIDSNNVSNISTNWTEVGNHNKSLGLAMLKIDPPANVRFLPKSQNHTEGVEEIQVYGWIVTKNNTEHEVMTAASFPAKVMGSEECNTHHSFIEDHSILCLIPQNNSTSKMNKMNSGGPVLLDKNGELFLLGVAQLHHSVPSLMISIAKHVFSIDTILHNN